MAPKNQPVRNLEVNEKVIGPDDDEPAYTVTTASVAYVGDDDGNITLISPADLSTPTQDRNMLVLRIAAALGYKVEPSVAHGSPTPPDANHPTNVVFDGRTPEWDILTPDGHIFGFRVPQSEIAAQFPDWMGDPAMALKLPLKEKHWIIKLLEDGDWLVAIAEVDADDLATYSATLTPHARLSTAAVLAWLEANE